MEQKLDTTWQKNANSQIVLDSIFAALAGIWITFGFSEKIGPEAQFLVVIFSLLAFFCLAISAEGTTTAYDERDVLKFVYYLFWYNIGVVLLGAAIAAVIFAHFKGNFVRYIGSGLWCLSPNFIDVLVKWGYGVSFLGLLWHWIRDAIWICCSDIAEFNDYLHELNDEATPKPHRRRVMSLVFRRRIKNEQIAS